MKKLLKRKLAEQYTHNGDNSPRYIGFVDNHWGPNIRGWAINKNRLEQPVWVHITGDGVDQVVKADQFREDIKSGGMHPTGKCGFFLPLSATQTTPVQVTVIEKVLSLAPSNPLYKGRKLFFMHIAKTAGSSVNTQIADNLQSGEFAFHIEGEPDWGTLKQKKFISGHIPYPRFAKTFDEQDYVLFSFLRNPIDQLVSHLYWVRHLSEPGIENFKESHPKVVQNLSEKLSLINFKDNDQLKKFVEGLSNIEAPLFDNCQCRYFYPIPAKLRYDETFSDRAIEQLRQFHFVGLTENYQKTMKCVSHFMGWKDDASVETRTNVNRFDYGIDKKNEEVKQILMPLIKHDLKLYQAGQQKFKQMIASIELQNSNSEL